MDNPFYCQDRDRRRRVRNQMPGTNGVEVVRVVSDDPPVLEVRVFRDWPHHPHHPLTPDNVRVEGGRHPLHPKETSHFENDPNGGGLFHVTLDCPGDPATTYTLRLVDAHDPAKPPAGFDAQLSHAAFAFRRRDILDEDPQADLCPPDPPPPAPPIDYLAKDYASFRRLMLDRLSQTVPAWTERRAADLGVTLVEVLAYLGDHLSYYQDAAATEAYLATARRRTSVRRHVRLVDYPMHDGCNARTWACLRVAFDAPDVELRSLTFYTSPDPLALTGQGTPAPPRGPADLAGDTGYVVFEPVRKNDDETRGFFESHNEINFYTWGDGDCCLPRGATAATLVTPDRPLKIGDVLFLEEVRGPVTGQPADADARHRWFVRLTGVEAASDNLPPGGPVQLLNVSWDVQDALPFPLCVSAGRTTNVSVARGNVLLVDHGLTLGGVTLTIPDAPPGAPEQRTPLRVRLATPLEHASEGTEVPLQLTAPITWAAPYPGTDAVAALQAWRLALRLASGGFASLVASPARLQSLPKHARAEIAALERQIDGQVQRVIDAALAGQPMSADAETGIDDLLAKVAQVYERATAPPPAAPASPGQQTAAPAGPLPAPTLATAFEFIGPAARALTNDPLRAIPVVRLYDTTGAAWLPRRDLLASGPDDRHFVVEVEEDGDVWLRFGDGVHGRAPDPGTTYAVDCRVGNGAAGNVGAETLQNLFQDPVGDPDWLLGARNPLPAVSGTDPEPLERVRLLAPTAFRTDLRRAVCAEDYAALAEKDSRVQRAAAQLVWTGTHYEVRVAIDLLDEAISPQFDPDLQRALIFDQLTEMLSRYRRMGHELSVVPPNYVPLVLGLRVCVAAHAERGRVKAAVEGVLGAATLPGGKRGFFHPDNLTFGQTIDPSRLVALVQGVPNVTSVTVTEFRRESDPPGCVAVELTTGPLEVPQLDGTHGQLNLELVGGR